MARGKKTNTAGTPTKRRGRPPKQENKPKKRGRPKKTEKAPQDPQEPPPAAPAAQTAPEAEKTPETQKDKQKTPKKAKPERRREFAGERKAIRQITDTVGLTLHLREEDPLPTEGGEIRVETESGEKFTLRVSKVQKTRKGFCVWCWLRKGAGDGKRWIACRLQKATITW